MGIRKNMKPTYEILQGALIAAFWYYPTQMKELIPKLKEGRKIASSAWLADAIFENLYINIFNFPLDDYVEWKALFFCHRRGNRENDTTNNGEKMKNFVWTSRTFDGGFLIRAENYNQAERIIIAHRMKLGETWQDALAHFNKNDHLVALDGVVDDLPYDGPISEPQWNLGLDG
jgi:hypothetical protein